MAQAKTRASSKRSPTKKRTQSSRAKKPQAQSKRSVESRSSNGKARVKAVRQTVESSTKDAGQVVGKAASKAKTPLLAGGAALAGAAGGIAIGAMRSRQSHSHKVLGLKAPHPKRVKVRSRDVARAAKEVGSFGQHVGELATELRHVREDAGGNGSAKRRSPVEVVLDGLTARR
jgi:hypothetical protein